jgi:hypothetical protein
MREMGNKNTFFFENLEGRDLRRQRPRLEDDILTDLRKIRFRIFTGFIWLRIRVGQ